MLSQYAKLKPLKATLIRLTEEELTKIDDVAKLNKRSRSSFIVKAALEKANIIIKKNEENE
jgi:uncharacterized protein (DUF1778 family)